MDQRRLLLAATILLSMLLGIATASTAQGNARSLNLSPRYINGGARAIQSRRVLNTAGVDKEDNGDEETKNSKRSGGQEVDVQEHNRQSKKSKRISLRDDHRLKASKRGSSPTQPSSPSSPTPGGSPSSPTGSANSPDNGAHGGSADSVDVDSDSFQLFYTLSEDREPAPEEFLQLGQITSVYLEGYMRDIFGDGMEIFSTFVTFRSYTPGEPARVDYRCVGTFRGDYEGIPSASQLNALISVAFSGPNLQTYMGLFDNLPGSNVFSTITEVVQPAAASSNDDSTTTGMIVAAAVCSLLVCAGAAHCVRRQEKKKKNQASDPDNADKLNGEGSDAGTIQDEGDDSTVVASQTASNSFCGAFLW